MKKFFTIFLIFLVVIFAATVVFLLSFCFNPFDVSEDLTQFEIKKHAVIENKEDKDSKTNKDKKNQKARIKYDIDDNMFSYLTRRIDFDYLRKTNSDILSWVTIPSTNVDYPVMCDNTKKGDYYLYHDIYGRRNYWGAVFTYPYPLRDYEPAHRVFYGHHMNNLNYGFGSLYYKYSKSYKGDKSREIYMYYPDRVECYKVYTAVDSKQSDKIYSSFIIKGSTLHKRVIEDLKSKGRFHLGKDLKSDEKMLVLSTCGLGNKDVRFYVVGKPFVKYTYKTNVISKLR